MIHDLFRQMPLFAGLDEPALASLAAQAVVRMFPANAILITEGDLPSTFYVIISGEVRVYASDEQGREVLLNTLGPGEYFGELSLLDDQPRSASVMTTKSSRLAIISKESFLDCLNRYPVLAGNLLRALSDKVRLQTAHTKSLALLGVYERMVQALMDLAVEQGGVMCVEGLSHRELAQRINASREMVTLILNELKRGDYIEVKRKRIVIKKRLPAKW